MRLSNVQICFSEGINKYTFLSSNRHLLESENNGSPSKNAEVRVLRWGQGSSNDSYYNYTIGDSTYKGDASEAYTGFRKAQIEPLNSKRIE